MRGQPTARAHGFAAFTLISGTGFLLDAGLTMGLVFQGLPPFWASLAGAAAAVTFVYVASRLGVFGHRKIGPAQDFALYVLWQVAAITAASVIVAALAHVLAPLFEQLVTGDALVFASGAAKVLVTPLTLLANYLFLNWLTQRGARTAPAAGGERP